MPKYQSVARTRDGHTFRSAVFDHTEEEIIEYMDHLDVNWEGVTILRVAEENGYTCIPRDNVSFFSFKEVYEN